MQLLLQLHAAHGLQLLQNSNPKNRYSEPLGEVEDNHTTTAKSTIINKPNIKNNPKHNQPISSAYVSSHSHTKQKTTKKLTSWSTPERICHFQRVLIIRTYKINKIIFKRLVFNQPFRDRTLNTFKLVLSADCGDNHGVYGCYSGKDKRSQLRG